MTEVLLDTLLWTGILIGLVLLLRRPVARHLGPKAAYALWFLPLMRLAMPPIVLPAWMRGVEPAVAPVGAAEPPMAGPATMETVALPVTQTIGAAPATLPSPVDFITPLMVLWLAGATIFLVRRFSLYFAMRRDLLDGARPVGDVGNIRMVESRSADGPVAFGVIDKVIALPWDFMANRDRETRDLAIAHELAHHRGHDLLVNFLVQPLFALHWFNPLGMIGWRAMRRDQEAACDARVVAVRPREQRAHYADIIAGFATAAKTNPRHALAAPMACPVLGDKSIIHRLRSLSMPNLSKRRRFAGGALFVGAALALPTTATISYAQQEAPQPPEPVTAPAPPAPPTPPTAPEVQQFEDEQTFEEAFEDAEEVEERRTVIIRREIERAERDIERAERDIEREVERAEREIERAEREIERAEREIERDNARVVRIEKKTHSTWSNDRRLTDEERRKLKAELKETRERLGSQEFRTEMRLAVAEAQASIPEIRHECKGKADEVVHEYTSASGKTVLAICNKASLKLAMNGLKEARKAIKNDPNLSDEERREALESIDEAYRDMRDEI